jgi:acyl carrier protein
MDWTAFSEILARRARVPVVLPASLLFGDGINISSVSFLESIMELEEQSGLEIDVDGLDISIRTAGQLYVRLFPGSSFPADTAT